MLEGWRKSRNGTEKGTPKKAKIVRKRMKRGARLLAAYRSCTDKENRAGETHRAGSPYGKPGISPGP